MQRVCDVLEELARVVYLVSLHSFDKVLFSGILARYGLTNRWGEWSTALGL